MSGRVNVRMSGQNCVYVRPCLDLGQMCLGSQEGQGVRFGGQDGGVPQHTAVAFQRVGENGHEVVKMWWSK